VYREAPWTKKKKEEQPLEFLLVWSKVFEGFLDIIREARDEHFQKLADTWPELPAVMVDGIDLIDTDLPVAEDTAAQTALAERLDLMNAQAQVVDAWRQIRILANSLLGVFNVRYHLDSSTPPGLAKPLDFDENRTRHQLIFNGELPLVRKAERNAYRAGLIGFERARRAFMANQDVVVDTLREEVRQLRLLARQYKNQQDQVKVAYSREESARQKYFAPPEPGRGRLDSGTQAALTNQLLQSQAQLLNAQNSTYSIWINYLIARMQLYRDLERMTLDQRGVWIDELTTDCPAAPEGGSLQPGEQRGRAPEQLPPAENLEGPALGPPQ
jgi:hypothetical protein